MDAHDEAAAYLVSEFAKDGDFTVVVRKRSDGPVRLVYVQAVTPEQVGMLLRAAADTISDGAYQSEVRKAH